MGENRKKGKGAQGQEEQEGRFTWEGGPVHRLPGGEGRPTERGASYGDPPSAPNRGLRDDMEYTHA